MNTETQSPSEELDYENIGTDEQSVAVASQEIHDAIDNGLNLKLISIRLPVNLIDELKMISEYHGIGYQPFVRKMLQRFAHAELKKMAVELFEQRKSQCEDLPEQRATGTK